jgi:hypothetical protein
VLSRQLDFIRKKDKTKTLLKEGKDSLKYSKEVAIVYEIVEDLAIKQKIKEVYKGDVKACIA